MSIQPELSSFEPIGPAQLTPSDERTWAMLAHLSVLVNLFTGALGPLIPLVMYLSFKDRSRYVAYQSLQAFIFQLLWWVGGGVVIGGAWLITVILMPVLVGFLCLPIALVISFLPLGVMAYGVIGGLRASQGEDFKYWLVGDWMRGTLTQ